MEGSPYLDPAVAATYDRLAAPIQFTPPARDLVAMIEAPIGGVVLDVGTGTGAVAVHAAKAVGPTGLVVGIDPSPAMLRASRRDRSYRVAVARSPGLPFRDAVFDAVTASFVLSHAGDYRTALADMVRVCKVGARVGISGWGAGSNPVGQAWRDVAVMYVPGDRLERAFRALIPWEEPFAHAERLEQTLRNASLTTVQVTRREYLFNLTVTDFLSMKELTVEGTLLRRMLDPNDWDRFRHQVADVFRERYADTVSFVRDVHFGIGTKGGNPLSATSGTPGQPSSGP
jgi:ubiquinone/menaquinone biosynthesis C-methylase UbiE